jgi:tyrosine-specific transport protein
MKKLGATMLVAGTAIGSGMLALPITLAKLGLFQAVCLMIATSILTYYSALINLELHLQSSSKKTLSLGKLAKYFSGIGAEFIGSASVKLLSFALMAVFIYAGSSVSGKLIKNVLGIDLGFEYIAFFYSFFAVVILSIPMRFTDYINRILFICLICVTGIIISGLSTMIDWNILPETTTSINIASWYSALPIVFTSFGFQASIPTIVDYCDRNEHVLKKVFFWGSILPVVVYLCWTITVLLVIYQNNPAFYVKMTLQNIEVSALIEQLSAASHWKSIKIISWWISFFAILTSVIGVGIGLVSSLEQQLKHKFNAGTQIPYALLSVIPAYLIAVRVPNAFITILGFAGMLLSVIATLLPIFLLTKIYISRKKFHYLELENGIIPITVLIFGIAIVIAEIINMI